MIRILDTNVLLDRSIQEVIQSFEPCQIIIPLAVVQELDHFKKYEDFRGRNAREAGRFLDYLRKHGKLSEGVTTEYGSVVRVETNYTNVELPELLDKHETDNRILMVAKGLMQKGHDVRVITQDICERIIGDIVGVQTEDYTPADTPDELYTGWTEINISEWEVQDFYENGLIHTEEKLLPNQYVVMHDALGGMHYGRYLHNRIFRIDRNMSAWGIRPAKGNIEQVFLMDLLLNDQIKLVTAVGPAGTGKTLLALAAGLQKTMDERKYRKLVVSRSTIPIGNDIGFLPGDKVEKLIPWMGAIFDNLEFLTSEFEQSKNGRKLTTNERINEWIDQGYVELEALTFIRGRSIPQQWIVIDEAQNITKDQMKTIISRAGNGTKIVVTGDIEQVDNHRLSSSNNGLVHLVERFKGQDIFGHVTLSKTERSKLSELAVQLL